MCLAVPAKVIAVGGSEAAVELDGVRRSCVISFLPEVQEGDYVLIHAGFAIRKWSAEDFREYEEILGDTRHSGQSESRPDESRDHSSSSGGDPLFRSG